MTGLLALFFCQWFAYTSAVNTAFWTFGSGLECTLLPEHECRTVDSEVYIGNVDSEADCHAKCEENACTSYRMHGQGPVECSLNTGVAGTESCNAAADWRVYKSCTPKGWDPKGNLDIDMTPGSTCALTADTATCTPGVTSTKATLTRGSDVGDIAVEISVDVQSTVMARAYVFMIKTSDGSSIGIYTKASATPTNGEYWRIWKHEYGTNKALAKLNYGGLLNPPFRSPGRFSFLYKKAENRMYFYTNGAQASVSVESAGWTGMGPNYCNFPTAEDSTWEFKIGHFHNHAEATSTLVYDYLVVKTGELTEESMLDGPLLPTCPANTDVVDGVCKCSDGFDNYFGSDDPYELECITASEAIEQMEAEIQSLTTSLNDMRGNIATRCLA